MYALIDIRGKQYRAEKDALIQVDRLHEEAGAQITFNSVLLLNSGKDVKVGLPYVKGAKVTAEVVEHLRGKKITVFKYRRRKDSMSKNGHRSHYSILKITDINM
ncbi:MAG: 50S ribosomal protein L21 [Salinispira sp.]